MSDVVRINEAGDYPKQIQRAADLLKSGNLVVLPTETVYGAAADIATAEGRRRLRELRGNGEDRPFIIHLARREDALQYLGDVSKLGTRMMKKLWPGPVALVFEVPAERRQAVAERLRMREADLYAGSTITLRFPDHPVAWDVIGAVPDPVALSMVESPRNAGAAGAAWDHLAERVEMTLDAGPTRFAKPSTIVRVKQESYEIVREGMYDQRIIERLMRVTILFVCSGNTCRSPMAEAMARRIIAKKLGIDPDDLEARGISVVSAGAYALAGAKATPQAVDAVRELGADLARHRSRPLTLDLVHQADHIFTMSAAHARDVIALAPRAAEKTSTLDPNADIEDPIGGDISLYQELAIHLNKLIESRLGELELA